MTRQKDDNFINPKVVIVIPRYKEDLKNTETISLAQGQKILGDYDICYLSPEKMRSYYERTGEKTVYFSDECFESVKAYSLLMLSPEFYERFFDYELMLIYQLDAFVFYDKLNDFCDMGYDYIGAPLQYWVGWPYSVNRVGNGGLSLRNVRACYNAVKNYMSYVASKEPFLMSKLMTGEYGEDCYFIYCGWSKAIDFKTAPAKVAIKFSVQSDFNHVFNKLSENNLPFGCHGWDRANVIDIWKPYIEQRGYDLSGYLCKSAISDSKALLSRKPMKAYGMVSHLIAEMVRLDVREARERVLQALPIKSNVMAIWGNGSIGYRCVKLLSYLGKSVAFIIDKKACPNQSENGVTVVLPDYETIRNCRCPIIITSINYGDEIANTLVEMGLTLNKDYYFFWDIEKIIALEISAVMYKGRMYRWLHNIVME